MAYLQRHHEALLREPLGKTPAVMAGEHRGAQAIGLINVAPARLESRRW